MKKYRLMLMMLILSIFLSGCAYFATPPTPEDIATFLKDYRYDIDVVVDFLKSIDADDATIHRPSYTVFYDFEYHKIIEEDVQASLRQLWKAGCEFITIQNGEDTINFQIWSRTGNVSCGIACTLDGQGFPKAELQTECIPISDGWFYYFADYEAFRSNPSKYRAMWDQQNQTGEK